MGALFKGEKERKSMKSKLVGVLERGEVEGECLILSGCNYCGH